MIGLGIVGKERDEMFKFFRSFLKFAKDSIHQGLFIHGLSLITNLISSIILPIFKVLIHIHELIFLQLLTDRLALNIIIINSHHLLL
jgi:hypothetical protein